MKISRFALGFAAAAVLIGCGSDDDSGSDPGMVIHAPVLDSVEPVSGGLHVMWTNSHPGCEEFEGERKTATSPYAVVFTVPGEADNKHDGTATANETYTYRLRCRVGTSYSDYSNEMSGNPQQN